MKKKCVMRKAATVIAILIILAGCGILFSKIILDVCEIPLEAEQESDSAETEKEGETRDYNVTLMEEVGRDKDFHYYRDTTTDVMYLTNEYVGYYAGGVGLTVMLDPETGLPLTHERFIELYQEKSEKDNTETDTETKEEVQKRESSG